MGLSIKLMACNGKCASCYETRIREAGPPIGYNLEKMLATLRREIEAMPKEHRRNAPCVHGGEPLLIPIVDLEKIFKLVYEFYGSTSIQTNGTLITDDHVELFKNYKTGIGVSIDGDTWELNLGRWNSDGMEPEEIQKWTNLVLGNMDKMKSANLRLSVITLLRKYNAGPDKVEALISFLKKLESRYEVFDIRVNECIVYEESRRAEEELMGPELGEVYCRLADECFKDPRRSWQPIRDAVDLLMGHLDMTCIFGECDPWKTSAERTIMADGGIGGCLKSGAALDGIQATANETAGRERYEVLPKIPQYLGGCEGCNFWTMCKGGCPGAGIGNDWRNKTRFCEGWKIAFNYVADKIKGIFPNMILILDVASEVRPEVLVQSIAGSTWTKAKRMSVQNILQGQEKTPCAESTPGHGDRPHGDAAHGDRHGDIAHGDHTDRSGAKR